MARWEFNVVDMLGADTGELLGARGRELTFQLGGPSTFSCSLPLTAEAAELVSAGDRRIKGYRTSDAGLEALRFHGPIWAPEEDGQQGLRVVAGDQYVMLERRDTSAVYAVATDQGIILQQLVEAANADGETGIRALTSLVTTSVKRTADWSDTSKPLSEIAAEFAGYFDGCDIELRPLDDIPGKVCDLVVHGARRGVERNEAWFGFGVGTESNCSNANRVTDMSSIANYIVARGDASIPPVVVSDLDSIAKYGRYEAEVSFADVFLIDALTALAIETLNKRKDPKRTITITPNKSAPPMFDDWDIGDTVPVDIRKGVLQYTGPARIIGATLQVDDNGGELVSSMTIEQEEDGSGTS